MTNLVDTCVRADNPSNPNPPSDGLINYVSTAGAWGIATNALYKSGGANQRDFLTRNSGSSAVAVEATFRYTNAGQGGPIARFVDTNNFITCEVYGSGAVGEHIVLLKCVAGAFAQLGATYDGTINLGDKIKLECTSGNAINVYQDSGSGYVLRITGGVQSAGASNTKHGLVLLQVSQMTWSDVKVTDLAAPSPTVVDLLVAGMTLAGVAMSVVQPTAVNLGVGSEALAGVNFSVITTTVVNLGVGRETLAGVGIGVGFGASTVVNLSVGAMTAAGVDFGITSLASLVAQKSALFVDPDVVGIPGYQVFYLNGVSGAPVAATARISGAPYVEKLPSGVNCWGGLVSVLPNQPDGSFKGLILWDDGNGHYFGPDDLLIEPDYVSKLLATTVMQEIHAAALGAFDAAVPATIPGTSQLVLWNKDHTSQVATFTLTWALDANNRVFITTKRTA